ncbi:unnamed protein product [Owenia fusiformis]|uniref:Uncharacterized protein n=1 Tax=Owenia fusiformis TaxID=6347 RepID=A0A8J1XUJ6_OWEFU|nr:unnamed protein product [Owenia fusiformis]
MKMKTNTKSRSDGAAPDSDTEMEFDDINEPDSPNGDSNDKNIANNTLHIDNANVDDDMIDDVADDVDPDANIEPGGEKDRQGENDSEEMDPELHRHPSGKGFICPVCNALQVNQQSWLDHVSVHLGTKNHLCKGCNRRFWYQESLNRHLLDCSQNSECQFCDKIFKTRNELNIHHKLVHFHEMMFSCSECDKVFNSRALMLRHMSTHSGVRPYACTLCDKRFTRQEHVRRHFQLHISPTKKNHICPLCNKGFTRSDSLAIHLKKCSSQKIEGPAERDLRLPADQTYLEMQEYRRRLYGEQNEELKTFGDLANEQLGSNIPESHENSPERSTLVEKHPPSQPDPSSGEPPGAALVRVKQEPFDDILNPIHVSTEEPIKEPPQPRQGSEDSIDKYRNTDNYVYYPETEVYPNDDYVMDYPGSRNGFGVKRQYSQMEDPGGDSSEKPLYEALFEELGNNARIKKKKNRKSRPLRVFQNGDDEYDVDSKPYMETVNAAWLNYASHKTDSVTPSPRNSTSPRQSPLISPDASRSMVLPTAVQSQPKSLPSPGGSHSSTSPRSEPLAPPTESPRSQPLHTSSSNTTPPAVTKVDDPKSMLRSLLGKKQSNDSNTNNDTNKDDEKTSPKPGDSCDIDTQDRINRAKSLAQLHSMKMAQSQIKDNNSTCDNPRTPSPRMVSLLTGSVINRDKLPLAPTPRLNTAKTNGVGSYGDSLYRADVSRIRAEHQNGDLIMNTKPQKPAYKHYENGVIETSLDRLSKSKELFGCKFCQMWFEDCALSLAHSALHSKHDPWQCTMCGKICKDKYDFMCHHVYSNNPP